MTAEVTNNAPNRTRRSLNDSIARMDQMIDGLADAIPGTIKDVLEQSIGPAISEGIKAAVLEVLANPELLNTLRASIPSPAPPPANEGPVILPLPQPTFLRALLSKTGAAVSGVARWCRSKVVTAGQSVAGVASQAVNRLASLQQRFWIFRHAPKALVAAVAAGCVAAIVALFAPNWAVVAASAVGGACLTAIVQTCMWFRTGFGYLALDSD
jgi:hypothetical protein